MLVGRFPQLSETFIIRKAMALAFAGHDVLVMSRRKGEMSLLESEVIPRNLRYEFLIPDEGPFSLADIFWIPFKVLRYLLLCPLLSIRLYAFCKTHRISDSKLKGFLRYLSFVNKQDVDVLHCEFLSVGYGYRFLRNWLKRPLVVSSRGSELNTLKITGYINEYVQLFNEADKIHVVSSAMAEKVACLSIDPSKVFINRPAIALKDFIESNQKSVIINIISVGRLVWIKGYDYLLEALRLVKADGVRFSMKIVGDGPLYPELRFSIADLGLAEEVTLTGPLSQSEVRQRLGESQIFVLSSHDEGISNAVLEAMASGLAVITTSCGGMEEVIVHERDGLIVPTRQPQAMANAIKILILDDLFREQLGKNARKRVESDFDISRQVHVFESNYSQILGKSVPVLLWCASTIIHSV